MPPTAVSATTRPQVSLEAVPPDDPQAGGVGAFRVWRDDTQGNLTVRYHLGGSAVAGVDFAPLSGEVTITEGNRSAPILLEPLDYSPSTGMKTVSVTLEPEPGYEIISDPSASVRLGLFTGRPEVSVTATEGGFTFRRSTTAGPLRVEYVAAGDAVPGRDYETLPGVVVIPAGQDRVTLPVHSLGAEGAGRRLELTLRPAGRYTLGAAVASLSLSDETASAPPSMPADTSSHPIRYYDGMVVFGSRDLATDGFGTPWGHTRSWTNIAWYTDNQFLGSGWVDTQMPYLVQDGFDDVTVVLGDLSGRKYTPQFDGSYAPQLFTPEHLAYDSTAGEFVFTDAAGNRFRFYGFSTSLPAAQRGRFKSFTDPAGNVTEVTDHTTDGKIEEVQRSYTDGSTTWTESYLSTYLTTGTNAGLLGSVVLRRKVNSGSWTTVRQTEYAYYDGVEAHGPAGALKTATLKDGSGTTLDTEYYRYYVTGESNGYNGALKYAFRGPAYARLVTAVGSNVASATDAQVAPYADHYFEYDIDKRVTKEIAAGAGSSDDGGQGTFTFSYTTSNYTASPNNWSRKTVETLPDGNQNIVYTNAHGATVLSSFKETSSGDEWITYNRYTSDGKLLLSAGPSAITGYSDSYADLLNFQLGASSYLRDDAGPFAVYEYATTTTATSTTAGTVANYLDQISLRRGETGTDVPQVELQYFSRTSGGVSIYPVASTTAYRDTGGTGAITTQYAYTWQGSTFAPQSVTVTLPTVGTSQNGPGTSDTETVWLNALGQPVWTKDADGFLSFAAFDPVTGALTKQIADVDTTQTTTFTGLPSGWSTPSGGGLHLVAQFEVDALGRTTKGTDPLGNVNYLVYDDPNYAVRRYSGWNSSTNQPTGPTEVVRIDRPGSYVETLTMTATPAVTGS